MVHLWRCPGEQADNAVGESDRSQRAAGQVGEDRGEVALSPLPVAMVMDRLTAEARRECPWTEGWG